MTDSLRKDKALQVPTNAPQRERLAKAVEIVSHRRGEIMSLAEFIREAALRAADQVIAMDSAA